MAGSFDLCLMNPFSGLPWIFRNIHAIYILSTCLNMDEAKDDMHDTIIVLLALG